MILMYCIYQTTHMILPVHLQWTVINVVEQFLVKKKKNKRYTETVVQLKVCICTEYLINTKILHKH